QGLRHTRDAFEQDVSPCEQRGHHIRNDAVLSHHDAGQRRCQLLEQRALRHRKAPFRFQRVAPTVTPPLTRAMKAGTQGAETTSARGWEFCGGTAESTARMMQRSVHKSAKQLVPNWSTSGVKAWTKAPRARARMTSSAIRLAANTMKPSEAIPMTSP